MSRIFRVHFNRIAMQRNDPLVWSVQTSKGCFHAAKVIMSGQIETEFQPQRRTNPRAFFSGRGEVKQVGDVVYVQSVRAGVRFSTAQR